MPNDDQPVERRQERANSVQVSGTTFRLLLTFTPLALVGVSSVIWDLADDVRDMTVKLEERSIVGERRMAKLERLYEEHQREVAEWKYRIINHENAIRECQERLNRYQQK